MDPQARECTQQKQVAPVRSRRIQAVAVGTRDACLGGLACPHPKGTTMRANLPSTILAIVATATVDAVAAQQIDLSHAELIDLTHSFNASTLYWPTSPSKFELEQLSHGPSEGGYFYSAYSFCSPEHGGTHLDAPIHFAEGGQTTDELPLSRLFARAVVIDVSAKAARERDYRLTPADVRAFEREYGRITPGTVVLLRTGWSRYWPDAKAYLGDDKPGDASRLSFPSYGSESAQLLVSERQVAALGVDVASIDYGRSTDFMVHRIAMAAGVPGFENLTNLDRLPATGAIIVALPMKIEDGSGGPLRAIALVPHVRSRAEHKHPRD
jgi:kynurenine formamidase